MRQNTSPAPPGDDGGDQDRSTPWSGFDDELLPDHEARPATPPALTPLPPPESAPGPSSLPLPTQPPSVLTLALLMNMMSTFQSEMKSLRSDLSGSVSSKVAEAVAAQLPQVFLVLFVQALLNFCQIILLYCSYTCCTKFWGLFFIRPYPTRHPLRCLLSRTCPWPRNLPGFPNRDRRDPTAPRFWLVILFFHIALTCVAAICFYTCLIVFLVVIQHSFLRIGSYDPLLPAS